MRFRHWLRTAAFLLLCGASIPCTWADDPKMLFIEYALVAFGLDPDSFNAQPKKVWRGGETYLRLEEVPNPETGSQRLLVITEPDIWIIDRTTGLGRHEVDPGPTYRIRFPVFTADSNEDIVKLEMGMEREFFREHGATEAGEKSVAGVECKESVLELGGRKVSLFTRTSDGVPFQVTILLGERALAVRYLRYETGLALDKSLFKPPQDIKFEEPKKP